MANLRDIKRRIKSVKNTRQITKAMKLVSGAKLRRAQERATAARPYAEALGRVLERVVGTVGDDASHPLLAQPGTTGKVLVIVVASDKGLCGSFNGILFRRTTAWLKAELGEMDVEMITYGRKAKSFFSKRANVLDSHIELKPEDYERLSSDLAVVMTSGFTSGTYEAVYLVYNRFESVLTQEPDFVRVLPMALEDAEQSDETALSTEVADAAAEPDYKYEPSAQQLLDTLLPLKLQTTLLQAFFDSEAGEHASRMTAMDNATRNASDLIDALTLKYNRARQAAITTQLIEIVAGAEAL